MSGDDMDDTHMRRTDVRCRWRLGVSADAVNHTQFLRSQEY
jgi:hypothetical protein